jgi:hypothetical protein
MKKATFVAIVAALAILLSWDPARAMVYLDSTGRTVQSVFVGPHVNRGPIQPIPSVDFNQHSGIPDWDAIAVCESGGRWDVNSGNGYWGGLQFAPGTWFAYGGEAFDGTGPFPYSRAEQIAVAERVLAAQGPGAWPSCFRWAS